MIKAIGDKNLSPTFDFNIKSAPSKLVIEQRQSEAKLEALKINNSIKSYVAFSFVSIAIGILSVVGFGLSFSSSLILSSGLFLIIVACVFASSGSINKAMKIKEHNSDVIEKEKMSKYVSASEIEAHKHLFDNLEIRDYAKLVRTQRRTITKGELVSLIEYYKDGNNAQLKRKGANL